MEINTGLSVSIALKTVINVELDRLVNAEILINVVSSDWAAPIVPVPKKGGKIRIGSDYKVSVEFLGHCVDSVGIHTSQSKFDAIVNAPSPSSVSKLQSFLGLLNYYSKFVCDFASVLHPLNQLLCNVK